MVTDTDSRTPIGFMGNSGAMTMLPGGGWVQRKIVAGMLSAAAIGVAIIYLALLLPLVVLGLVAKADYDNLGCPGANQCSDAATVMTLAVISVLAGPIIWLLFKALRAAARLVRARDSAA